MFLTLEDPRARIDGSIDPLGGLLVWYWFGRRLVGNLTTVSNSVRGFTTLLLARYYMELLIEDGQTTEEDALEIFLCFEQIAAYARHVGHEVDSEIRGIERVKRFVAEQGTRVPIGVPSGAILGDQKTTGLWGLFSVPARASGLIAEGPVGLTEDARDFVRGEYAGRLRSGERDLMRLCRKGGMLNVRRNDSTFRTIVSVFSPAFSLPEVAFYGETLRDGLRVADMPRGRQAMVARLLHDFTDMQEPTGRLEVETLRARSSDPMLTRRLERVLRLEGLLAPAGAIFSFLQARNGRRPRDLAAELRDRWGTVLPHLDRAGFRAIDSEIEAQVGPEIAREIRRTDEALAAADYDEGIDGLLAWNRLVMSRRGGAPWIRVSSGKLDVRYRAQEERLPEGDQVSTLWHNTYFLDSLKDVTRQLLEVA